MAPAGHTARQCWHRQQPRQPNRSKGFITGYPSLSCSITMPEHTFRHRPHRIHFDLSTIKWVRSSNPISLSSYFFETISGRKYSPQGAALPRPDMDKNFFVLPPIVPFPGKKINAEKQTAI
jgi:hypothetical protein